MPASLGDYVWNDTNKNGVQDAGEMGIAGVKVELYTCVGSLVATTFTDANGYYSFTNLMPGDYYVKFYVKDGYAFTLRDQGGDDAKDSDADPATGKTVCTTLTPGENDMTWDAGMYTVACTPLGTGTPGYWMNHPEAWPVDSITIGGVVYSKDKAILLMKAPVELDKTYTMFPALVSAKLNVLVCNDASCIADTIQAADDWMRVYGPVGSGVLASSKAWKIGEPLYLLLDKYNNGLLCAPSRDGVELYYGVIGNYVWKDIDKDGKQDLGEPALPGVTITLSGNGIVPMTAVSDAGGYYQFKNLRPGTYSVAVAVPAGYLPSPVCSKVTNIDGDANCSGLTVSSYDNTNNTIDFGFYVTTVKTRK